MVTRPWNPRTGRPVGTLRGTYAEKTRDDIAAAYGLTGAPPGLVVGTGGVITPDPPPDPFTDGYSVEFDVGRSDADHVDWDTSLFTLTGSFSVAVWYKPTLALNQPRYPFGKWNPADSTECVFRVGHDGGLYAGRPALYMRGSTGSSPNGLWIARASGTVTLNAWNFVIYVYDQGLAEGRIYRNGNKDSITYVRPNLFEPYVPDELRNVSYPVQLNPANPSYAGGFTGIVGEVAMYNKAINDSEASDLWNGGAPMHDWSLLSSYTDCFFWERCGDGPSDAYPNLVDVVGSASGTMYNMDSGDIVGDTP